MSSSSRDGRTRRARQVERRFDDSPRKRDEDVEGHEGYAERGYDLEVVVSWGSLRRTRRREGREEGRQLTRDESERVREEMFLTSQALQTRRLVV